MNRFMKRKQTEVWLREGLRKEKMKTVAEKEKADRTALLSTQAYRTALGTKTVSELQGTAPEAGPVYGMDGLALQAVLFLGIMAVYHVLFRTVEGTVDLFFYRRFQDFLCGAGILSAWSSVPFLFRSYRWNMAEVEAASRCSMLHLRAAQLLLIGGGAVLMVAGVAGTVLLQTAAGTEQVAVLSGISISALWKLYPVFSQKKGSSLSVTGLQRSGCRAPGGFPGVEQDFSGDRI